MNLIAERSISISVRRITRQLAHGIMMGVLSIVAGVMLTLAVAGLDTYENSTAVHAAVQTRQNEGSPLNTGDSENVSVIVHFAELSISDNVSEADSNASTVRLSQTSKPQTPR